MSLLPASAVGRSADSAAAQALASDWTAPEPGADLHPMVVALVERARNSIDELADRIDPDAAFQLVTQSTPVGFFVGLSKLWAEPALAAQPALPPADPARRPAALAFKQAIAAAAGGLLTAEEVRARRGIGKRQAIYRAVTERRLLAVKDNGNVLLPAIQFDGNGKGKPWVSKLARATPSTDGWTLLQWLLGESDALGGQRPIDLLDGSDDDRARALRLATSLEE